MTSASTRSTTKAPLTDRGARFTTQTGQLIELRPVGDPSLPAPVQDGPSLRKIVWGVDTPEALDTLAADLLTDSPTSTVRYCGYAAAKAAVLDRLMTAEFRAKRPDLAFLFRQMGTFNTAKMQDLTNLDSDGPTVEVLNAAPFPLLLLAGEKDAVLSPATVRRAGEPLPNARVEVVTDAPHSMYWERPDLFNGAIRRFLKEVATA